MPDTDRKDKEKEQDERKRAGPHATGCARDRTGQDCPGMKSPRSTVSCVFVSESAT